MCCIGRKSEQFGGLVRWTVYLQPHTLRETARYSDAVIPFNDPFGFEIHVLPASSSTMILFSELHVTSNRQLNGVRVECTGNNGTFESMIQVASVGECVSEHIGNPGIR